MEPRLHQRRPALTGDPRPGYTGSCRQVRGCPVRFRGTAVIQEPAPAPPKVKGVTAWIMIQAGRLADTDRAGLDAILAASPGLAAVTASVRAFAVVMTGRCGRSRLKP